MVIGRRGNQGSALPACLRVPGSLPRIPSNKPIGPTIIGTKAQEIPTMVVVRSLTWPPPEVWAANKSPDANPSSIAVPKLNATVQTAIKRILFAIRVVPTNVSSAGTAGAGRRMGRKVRVGIKESHRRKEGARRLASRAWLAVAGEFILMAHCFLDRRISAGLSLMRFAHGRQLHSSQLCCLCAEIAFCRASAA